MFLGRLGAYKPLVSTNINWAHPFVRNLLFMVPGTEPVFNSVTSSANGGRKPLVIWGKARPPVPTQYTTSSTLLGSNAAGNCFKLTNASNDFLNIGPDPFGAAAATVCCIRRKRDSTARASALFGQDTGTSNVRCSAHVPFSDGIVYFDFGGTTGSNRVTVSGLSFAGNIERWVFAAGPKGMSIWRNGIKLTSSSTAVTRSTTTANFVINAGVTSPVTDEIDVNFFMAINEQWDDAMIRAWSAAPYEHLYTDPYLGTPGITAGGGGGGGATFPALTLVM